MSIVLEAIKRILKAKIIKPVIAFLIINIVPLIIGAVVLVLVIGGISVLFDFFGSIIEYTPLDETVKIKQWAEQLSDEEVKHIIESGSPVNPKLIPDYIAIEEKGIQKNIIVDMKIVETEWDEDGGKKTKDRFVPYELQLYNAAYPYRLQWKLIAGLDIIDPKSTVWEIWKKEITEQADARLQPVYHWGYDKYSKDITEGKRWWVRETHDGVTTTRMVREEITEYYYPLEFLDKVEGTFADYIFSYQENVETLDTGWVEIEGSKNTVRWTTGGEPIYDDEGNIIGRTRVKHHSRTTWQEERTIIVEDLLDDITKTPRLDRIAEFFEDNRLSLHDLEILLATIEYMPNTGDLSEDLSDIIAITSLGLDASNYQSAQFNPNIPIIRGEWERKDLLNTAMAILDLYYFWGGKYPAYDANPNWGKPTIVTAKGNWATGKALPLGLDCSGFVDWVYYQMLGTTIGKGGGSIAQFANTYPIEEDELRVGDLGFYQYGGGKHVGIYAGTHNGKQLFIHSGGRQWKDSTHIAGRVVVTYNNTTEYYKGNAPSKFRYFRRPYVSFKDDPETQNYNE